MINQNGVSTTKLAPANIWHCNDGERTYYKDPVTGKCYANKACTLEINEDGSQPVSKPAAAPAGKK